MLQNIQKIHIIIKIYWVKEYCFKDIQANQLMEENRVNKDETSGECEIHRARATKFI